MAKILVVDDDENIRQLLAMHLSAAGHLVQVAEDAVVAGHLLLGDTPDLMIVDVNMPYMDGFAFVSAIRDDQTIPRIPTIFLTSDEEGFDRAKELGAGFLTKPVAANRLLGLIDDLVKDPRGA